MPVCLSLLACRAPCRPEWAYKRPCPVTVTAAAAATPATALRRLAVSFVELWRDCLARAPAHLPAGADPRTEPMSSAVAPTAKPVESPTASTEAKTTALATAPARTPRPLMISRGAAEEERGCSLLAAEEGCSSLLASMLGLGLGLPLLVLWALDHPIGRLEGRPSANARRSVFFAASEKKKMSRHSTGRGPAVPARAVAAPPPPLEEGP